ncbi:MAG: glycoside hydrolase family 3 N-terminal domain-containing protein [Chthoniobacterales bacterium]
MQLDHPSQILLTGVPGTELDAETAALFRRVQPGGFILFGRNIKSATQLRKLIDDLRDLSAIEPIITIDQEGGRVSRLRLIGNEPPNAQQLRDKDDEALVRRHGQITGRLLRLFGFNLDLCPVLDISFDDDADNSLRGRCFGRTVEQVVRLAGAFNDALRKEGIASCGKHFPGDSAAQLDAHHELPKIERTRAELEANELAVFRQFSDRVDSMMVCHGWYPTFDAQKLPASLSLRVVTELLRNDLAMICHRVDQIGEALNVLKQLPSAQTNRALQSVARFKKTLAPPEKFSEEKFRAIDEEIWALRVAVLGEERAAQRSPEDGARSPVETY